LIANSRYHKSVFKTLPELFMGETTPQTKASDGLETKKTAKSKTGCLKAVLSIGLFGLTAIVISFFVIDQLNIGRKLKADAFKLISQILKVPPPKPEVKIVEKIVKVEVPVEKIVEKIVKVEVLPPMPSSFISWQKIDTAKLWNGIQISNNVAILPGESATLERTKQDAIQLAMTLNLKIPTASQSIEALAQNNPNLPAILPGLGQLIARGRVSPFYHNLYERKTEYVQQNATRLSELISLHNMFDTETVLELENPDTQQTALLIQSDMDVVSDGSDGDRWPFLDNYVSMSANYQPFTSYGWAKRTGRPNPLLERMEAELKRATERWAVKGLSIEENRKLRITLDTLPKQIEDIKARSYLIAEADPFMVMSLSFLGRNAETKFGPMIGDYAVVIYGDKLYPVIIGDAGPTYKFGEASLRMAREINPEATPYNRPVSDLSVTYLVFPGSREEVNSPPDYAVWRQKCQIMLDKLGGVGPNYSLHQWEDIIPKKLEEWRANHPGEVIATPPPVPATVVDPATLPQPSFSTPVVPQNSPETKSETPAKTESPQ